MNLSRDTGDIVDIKRCQNAIHFCRWQVLGISEIRIFVELPRRRKNFYENSRLTGEN